MMNIVFKKCNRKAFHDRNSSSWQYPWDTKVSNKKNIEHRRTSPGACFKCGKASHWVKTALGVFCCQDPVQALNKQETRELIAPLCLDKLGQTSPNPTFLFQGKTVRSFGCDSWPMPPTTTEKQGGYLGVC